MSNAAIIAACECYDDSTIKDLKGVNQDAKLMKEALMKNCDCSEEDIYTLVNDDGSHSKPTTSQLLHAIDNISTNYPNKTINNLFLYYSGHGYMKDNELRLVLSDTILHDTDSAIPISRLNHYFDRIKNVKHIIVFLDACQSDYVSKGSSEKSTDPYSGNAVIFYSCLPHQSSYMLSQKEGIGSVYTKYLIEILNQPSKYPTVKTVSRELKKKLGAYCNSHKIEQCPHTLLFDDSFGDVYLVNKEEPHFSDQTLDLSSSIWLKDAEQAEGKQSRFETFTHTATVNKYIDPESMCWGLASVKGIGKTFLLQVKRIKMSKKAICFPDVIPSKANNWATECIKFADNNVFKNKETYLDIKLLWKYSLVCYIMHCWLAREGANKRKRNEKYEQILKWVEGENKNHNIADYTYQFLTDNGFKKLQQIMQIILRTPNWRVQLSNEYQMLQTLSNYVIDAISTTNKKILVLFLDKIDQTALRQPNSESTLDCENCSKSELIDTCKDLRKNTDYCYGGADTTCPQRSLCCYGCENYLDAYAGTNLRVDEGNSLRNSHCNYWQRLQLALVEAVSDIKDDFNSQIRIMYTIRLEAYNYAESVWSSQRSKIDALTCILSYSRNEQEKIYRECIKNQTSSLLFSPALADKPGREDEAFVGVSKICHPYVPNATESVFDVIYRHSFDRTRDIQDYGHALTERIQDIQNCDTEAERSAIVKQIIESTSARLAYSTNKALRSEENSYYFEKMPNMPSYWAEPDNFEMLMNRIDRNLLFVDDMQRICRVINQRDDCGDIGCENCKHHPFSTLKCLGMLGYIVLSENRMEYSVQQFLESQSVTYFHDEDSLKINNHTMYLIHPALTKSIEKLRNDEKIMHFCGFIIGKDVRVKQDYLREIFLDKQQLPREEFENKYYKKTQIT